jgi:hypothetical protein
MNIVIGMLLLCAAPLFGAYLGRRILERRWLSSRTRVLLASLPVVGLCAWVYLYSPWAAIAVALLGLFALREGRAYHVPMSRYGGLVEGPFGMYRPRVSDGATWGDVHRRDRNIIPWSQKSDLHEMQEGALGSIGSASGKRFEAYPPVIHRERPRHARLIVDNGRFPPKGSSAKRGQLKSVK